MELRCYLGICIITDGRHWCQCRQVAASSGHQSTDSLTPPCPPSGRAAHTWGHIGSSQALTRGSIEALLRLQWLYWLYCLSSSAQTCCGHPVLPALLPAAEAAW